MRWLALALIWATLTFAARADDWPQWLGPNRNGISKEIVKPWKGQPKVLWQADVGEGHSSPILAKGHVYVLDKVAEKDQERLTAWTADTGKQVGSMSHDRVPFASMFGTGPRATPAFGGDLIYTLGVAGRLSAEEFAADGTGKTRFSIDTLKEFEAKNLTFGVSASPLIDGDLVIALVGGKGAGIVAFDRQKGSVAWKALDDPASYASPIIVGEGKNRQLIALTQLGLVSLSPKDGQENWKFPFRDLLSESSTTPVVVGDLLVASSLTRGAVALKMTEKDGRPAVEQVWNKTELTCYFSTPVPVGKDHIYMVTGTFLPKPALVLRCVETATGKTLWKNENIGKYHAALLRTGDDKLLMLSDDGQLTLIDPGPAAYKELARAKICGETWAHPALANGKLYVRDNRKLFCLQMNE